MWYEYTQIEDLKAKAVFLETQQQHESTQIGQLDKVQHRLFRNQTTLNDNQDKIVEAFEKIVHILTGAAEQQQPTPDVYTRSKL